MTTASFDRLASVAASTKRQGPVVNGLAGAMATQIASLTCTPLDPVTPEIAQTAGLEVWVGLKQCMVDGDLNIANGDQFIVGSVTYKVRAVADYDWGSDVTSLLILEELK